MRRALQSLILALTTFRDPRGCILRPDLAGTSIQDRGSGSQEPKPERTGRSRKQVSRHARDSDRRLAGHRWSLVYAAAARAFETPGCSGGGKRPHFGEVKEPRQDKGSGRLYGIGLRLQENSWCHDSRQSCAIKSSEDIEPVLQTFLHYMEERIPFRDRGSLAALGHCANTIQDKCDQ